MNLSTLKAVSRISLVSMTGQVAMEPLVAITWLLPEYYERDPKFARNLYFGIIRLLH